ncbi:MAG TPA: biotin-independent malonate decarboxylase subunit beta [Burkholderiaceae bacterium]|nr:biotin-independent malonate decarboxylase subunit beta [Burkholderiaceae bacterium]
MNAAPKHLRTMHSFYEATARQRIAGLLDQGSFREILGPRARITSPHLPKLDAPTAFDDGVVIGSGALDGQSVLIAAQEGSYMGGAVGEVHGAKIIGLLRRAVRQRSGGSSPRAVLLLIDSGGVRLHEANAGLIAISEIMRAVLDARAAGIPVLGLIGGATGAFGGMGIVARLCTALVMSEEGRLALSGPEVIETVAGVEEFDARDRALVWRVTGGKHRYLIGDCDAIVGDDIAAFRQATIDLLPKLDTAALGLPQLKARHAALVARQERFAGMRDGLDVWNALGVNDPAAVPMLEAADFVQAAQAVRAPSE